MGMMALLSAEAQILSQTERVKTNIFMRVEVCTLMVLVET